MLQFADKRKTFLVGIEDICYSLNKKICIIFNKSLFSLLI